jgi:hypothetical protein
VLWSKACNRQIEAASASGHDRSGATAGER